MRTEDLRDYWRLRPQAHDAWRIVRFRKRRRPGELLRIDWRDARPPLYVPAEGLQFHVFHRIFLRDEYRLDRHAGRRWHCVVDLGANTGFFSARVAASADRVVAYEPVAEHFAMLRKNLAGYAHAEAVRAGVAGRAGEIRVDPRTGTHFDDGRSGEASAAVPLVQVFRDHDIARCDLVKIDVEGMEYEILYGAGPELLARVQRIYGEYHASESKRPDHCIEALADFLAEQGFAVERVAHRRKANQGMFFAERPEVAARASA